MRRAIVSALCSLIFSFCFTLPASAQSKQGTGGQAVIRSLTLLASPSGFSIIPDSTTAALRVAPADRQVKLLQELASSVVRSNLFLNVQPKTTLETADDWGTQSHIFTLQPESTPEIAENWKIQPFTQATTCAHILTYRAHSADSAMVKLASKSADIMTTASGLPTCREDIRGPVIPR